MRVQLYISGLVAAASAIPAPNTEICGPGSNCELVNVDGVKRYRFKSGLEPGSHDYQKRFYETPVAASLGRREDNVETKVVMGETMMQWGCDTDVESKIKDAIDSACKSERGCDEGSPKKFDIKKWASKSEEPSDADLNIRMDGKYSNQKARDALQEAMQATATGDSVTADDKQWKTVASGAGAKCSEEQFPNYVAINRFEDGNLKDSMEFRAELVEGEKTMDICDFPLELILEIAIYTSSRDFSQLVLAERRYEKCLSSVLYVMLLPLQPDSRLAEQGPLNRKGVLGWAVEHGSLRTLQKVNESEALKPCIINQITFKPSTTSADDGPLGSHELLPLHLAALCGQPSIVRYLIQRGADVNATVAHGLLPVHLGKTGEVVQILIASGSRLDIVDGTTPMLCSLTHHADSSAVAAFNQLGADPNQADSSGTTPAQVAVDQGNVDALKVLLEVGADIKQPLPGGETLIYRAVWLTRPDSPKSDAPSPYSDAAVTMIGMLLRPRRILMLSDSADVAQLLLERSADQHAAYSRKRKMIGFHVPRMDWFEEIFAKTLVANFIAGMVHAPPRFHGQALVEPECIKKLGLLIQHGGNIDAELGEPPTARELICPLLDLGADPCHQDQDGNQPIHILTGQFYRHVQENKTESHNLSRWRSLACIMDAMINKGADPNARDVLGRTAAMLLCFQPSNIPTAFLLKALLSRGNTDVNAADTDGYTTLHHVIGSSGALLAHESCFRLQVLLEYSYGKLDVNPREISGRTPLHVLLEARDLNGKKRDGREMLSCYNRRRAISMLLRAGAHVTTQKVFPSIVFDALSAPILSTETSELSPTRSTAEMTGSYTPPQLACVGRDPLAMLKIMLHHGAVADIDTGSGRLGLTPLMTVAGLGAAGGLTRNTLVKAIQLLLGAGADAELRDGRGRTAWDIFLKYRKTKFLWVWSPCLDRLMPEMPTEKRDKLLGLGATERPTVSPTEAIWTTSYD
ncbi:ankyrin repeat protein [Seiridium cupressi]